MSLFDPTNTTRLPQFKLQLCLEEAARPSPPEGETTTEEGEGEDRSTPTEVREVEPHKEGEMSGGEKEGERREGETSGGEKGVQTTEQKFEFYPSLSDLEAAVLSVVDTVGGAMKQVPDINVRS